jgi:hypothetical protein
MYRRFLCWALVGAAYLDAPSPVRAEYVFTTIDYPGAVSTEVNNIDNAGRVVGSYQDSAGGVHAYVLENGVFTSFDVPSALGTTSANGINATGQIVGWYIGYQPAPPYQATTRAYLRSGDVYTDLASVGQSNPLSSSFEAKAYAVNDAGHAVGYYAQPSNGVYRGFFYNGTNNVTLSGASQAIGINNSDAIVGYYFSGKPHGFLYTGGTYTTVDYPLLGSLGTVAQGINDTGDIAGIYFDANDKDHGFVKTSAGFTTVDYPGSIFSGLVGINNAGQVAGYYRDAIGFHGYLATPVAAADYNTDGSVDGEDLDAWSGNFGVSSNANKSMGDANGDGDVDGADFLTWQTQVSPVATFTAAAAVPEPSAAALVLAGGVALIAAARWRSA